MITSSRKLHVRWPPEIVIKGWTEGMALEMKTSCETCGRAMGPGDEAFICSYECSFCGDCTAEMAAVCPNCGGELLRRPRRPAMTG